MIEQSHTLTSNKQFGSRRAVTGRESAALIEESDQTHRRSADFVHPINIAKLVTGHGKPKVKRDAGHRTQSRLQYKATKTVCAKRRGVASDRLVGDGALDKDRTPTTM